MKSVLVRGGSFSAFACSAALSRLGWRVQLESSAVRLPEVVVVNEPARQLLQSIFDLRLERIGSRLGERLVRWGRNTTVRAVKETSWVVESKELLAQVASSCARLGVRTSETGPASSDWEIACDQPDSTTSRIPAIELGTRGALTAIAQLRRPTAVRLIMEDTQEGWIFFAPLSNQRVMIQALTPDMPADPEESFRSMVQSAAFGEAVSGWEPVSQYPVRPRLELGVVEKNRLFCGSAAYACDPISGDGIAFTVRASILAAAAVDRASAGDRSALDFYRFRLSTAFAAHCHSCLRFYQSSCFANRWEDQITLMERQMRAFQQGMSRPDRLYVLDNLSLRPFEFAAQLHQGVTI